MSERRKVKGEGQRAKGERRKAKQGYLKDFFKRGGAKTQRKEKAGNELIALRAGFKEFLILVIEIYLIFGL